MKKLKIERKKMSTVAEQHRQAGIEVKLWEAEKPETGRIIWVRQGKTILVMR